MISEGERGVRKLWKERKNRGKSKREKETCGAGRHADRETTKEIGAQRWSEMLLRYNRCNWDYGRPLILTVKGNLLVSDGQYYGKRQILRVFFFSWFPGVIGWMAATIYVILVIVFVMLFNFSNFQLFMSFLFTFVSLTSKIT